MLLDKQILFSDVQDIGAASTGTTASTNIYDSLAAGNDLGRGEELELVIVCQEAVTSGGSATLDVQLQTDDNDSFSSATVLWSTTALAKTAWTLGKTFKVKVPRGGERYYRVAYVVATAALTAGMFTAGVTLRGIDDYPAVPLPRATYPVS